MPIACIHCRGVAKFDGGVPMRMNSMRMLWGKGVRAGIYPLSDSEAYWFTTKNCPAVSISFMGWSQLLPLEALETRPSENHLHSGMVRVLVVWTCTVPSCNQ